MNNTVPAWIWIRDEKTRPWSELLIFRRRRLDLLVVRLGFDFGLGIRGRLEEYFRDVRAWLSLLKGVFCYYCVEKRVCLMGNFALYLDRLFHRIHSQRTVINKLRWNVVAHVTILIFFTRQIVLEIFLWSIQFFKRELVIS